MRRNSGENTWIDYQSVKGNPYLDTKDKLKVSDKDLADIYLHGNEQERSWVMETISYFYGNKVFKAIRRECILKGHSPEDAYDILNKALLGLQKGLSRYRETVYLGPWLRTIAIGVMLGKFRDEVESPIISLPEDGYPPLATNPSLEASEKELLEKARGKISRISNSLGDHYRLTLKVLYLSAWNLEGEAKEIRLIAKRSKDPEDTEEIVLIRINQIQDKLKDKAKNIKERDEKIAKYLNQLKHLLVEKADIERELEALLSTIDYRHKRSLSDRIDQLESEINRIEKNRKKLLEEKDVGGWIVETRPKYIAYILGESDNLVRTWVKRLKDIIRGIAEVSYGDSGESASKERK